MKCTLDDCHAPEVGQNKRKGSAHHPEARPQIPPANLCMELNHSSLPSDDREHVGFKKACLSSRSFKSSPSAPNLLKVRPLTLD